MLGWQLTQNKCIFLAHSPREQRHFNCSCLKYALQTTHFNGPSDTSKKRATAWKPYFKSTAKDLRHKILENTTAAYFEKEK